MKVIKAKHRRKHTLKPKTLFNFDEPMPDGVFCVVVLDSQMVGEVEGTPITATILGKDVARATLDALQSFMPEDTQGFGLRLKFLRSFTEEERKHVRGTT